MMPRETLFRPFGPLIHSSAWKRSSANFACPECALYMADGPMGLSRPDAFPNLEEFAQRLEDWPEPRYASEREMREYLDDE
jgi:hypothetical protein